jgi:hypothetical protein
MNDFNLNHTLSICEAFGPIQMVTPKKTSETVGQSLACLAMSNCQDITYVISEAARFSHNPKKPHDTAVKTIIRYLIGTNDKGVS